MKTIELNDLTYSDFIKEFEKEENKQWTLMGIEIDVWKKDSLHICHWSKNANDYCSYIIIDDYNIIEYQSYNGDND